MKTVNPHDAPVGYWCVMEIVSPVTWQWMFVLK